MCHCGIEGKATRRTSLELAENFQLVAGGVERLARSAHRLPLTAKEIELLARVAQQLVGVDGLHHARLVAHAAQQRKYGCDVLHGLRTEGEPNTGPAVT